MEKGLLGVMKSAGVCCSTSIYSNNEQVKTIYDMRELKSPLWGLL